MGFLSGIDEDLPYAGVSDQSSELWRFFVRRGEKREISFLHDLSCAKRALEHQFRRQKNYRDTQTFVCLKALGEGCPLCALPRNELQVSSYYAYYFLIVDHTPQVSKATGKTYADKLKLLVMKTGDLKRMKLLVDDLSDKSISLKGARFTVRRSDDQRSSRIGDMYSYMSSTDDLASLAEGVPTTPKEIQALFEKELLPDRDLVAKAAGWCVAHPDLGDDKEVDKNEDSVPWVAE